MSFLLTYAASTGVTTDPGPAGATYSFITTVPGGVTVSRSGSAMHINTSGFVVLDPVNLGRIDSDAFLDGPPPGSAAKELTGVSTISTAFALSMETARTLAAVLGSAAAGLPAPVISSATNATVGISSGAATGIPGNPGIGSVTVSGTSATGAPGNATVVSTGSASLSGNAASGISGIPAASSSSTSTISGTAASGSPGILGLSMQSPALSSAALAGSAGALAPTLVPADLAGLFATGATGTGTVAVTGFASLSGNAAAGAAGIPIPLSSTGSVLSGTVALGGTASLGFSTQPPGISSAALVGVPGTLGIALTPAVLSGLIATGSGGGLSVSAITLTGVIGTCSVGIMTLASTRTLAASVATGSAGTLTRMESLAGGFSSGFSSGFGPAPARGFSSGFSSGFR